MGSSCCEPLGHSALAWGFRVAVQQKGVTARASLHAKFIKSALEFLKDFF